MDIVTAVKKAYPKNAYIARKMWIDAGLNWKILPTNSLPCLIMKGTEAHGHWNPNVEDLTAEDWEILER